MHDEKLSAPISAPEKKRKKQDAVPYILLYMQENEMQFLKGLPAYREIRRSAL